LVNALIGKTDFRKGSISVWVWRKKRIIFMEWKRYLHWNLLINWKSQPSHSVLRLIWMISICYLMYGTDLINHIGLIRFQRGIDYFF
jgi:hypothetical protein